jgi:hypothetical protein
MLVAFSSPLGDEMSQSPRPVRLRLSREAGFNLQVASLATNGLKAVNVGRPSKWGNWIARKLVLSAGETAVAAFKCWIEDETSEEWKCDARVALGGKNLACWCTLNAPCLADVLLDFATNLIE